MKRRDFISLTIMTGAGATAARLLSPLSPKPIARLVNDEKGTWYKGRATNENVCTGDDLLLYEPDEHVESYRQQVDQLVKDGYAEYL